MLQLLGPMCPRVSKPQLLSLGAAAVDACALQQEKPLQRKAQAPQSEKARM